MNLGELISSRHLTDEQRQAAEELHNRGYESFTDIVQAIGEPALAVLSSSIAEPIAGLAGLATTAFGGTDRAVNVINAVTDKLAYVPKTEAGKSGMNTLGRVLNPVGDALSSVENYLGEGALELTGSPAMAAAAATMPAALMELNPIGRANKSVTKMDIFAGKKAKNANLEQMEAAQELARRGMDRDVIWKETGWFQDVDNQWKWEIDDSQYSLNPEAPQSSELGFKTAGGEVINHEGLKAAHPDITDNLTVSFEPNLSGEGSYRSIGASEILGKPKEHYLRLKDAAEQASGVNDKMRHIAKKIQEWSAPGHVESVAKEYGIPLDQAKLEVAEDIQIMYENLQKARDIDPTKVRFNRNTPSTALHELQHAVQGNEGFAKGGSPKDFKSDTPRLRHLKRESEGIVKDAEYRAERLADDPESDLLGKAKDHFREVNDGTLELNADGSISNKEMAVDYLLDLNPEYNAIYKEISQSARHAINPRESYKRLAGEAEARNVQTRIDMTPEERAAKPPWETLDVPEDELIVRGAD